MNNNEYVRFFGMLGFAMRAGKLTVGTDMTLAGVTGGKGKIKLVLVSADASDATKKRLINKCGYYGVECIVTAISASELGERLGKLYAPSAVGVTDAGFATELRTHAPRFTVCDCERDVTTKRKEVSDEETGDTNGFTIS